MDDVRICRDLIGDIDQGHVNGSSNAYCHIRKVGTLVMTLETALRRLTDNSARVNNAIFQGSHDCIVLCLPVQ